MKKYLLLILLTPFAYSAVDQLYCEHNVQNFLNLKINTDPKDPLFKIEDSFGYNTQFNKSLDKENIVIKKLHVTAFDDEEQHIFLFNKRTKVLVVNFWKVRGRKGKEQYEMLKRNMLNDKYMGPTPTVYTCKYW